MKKITQWLLLPLIAVSLNVKAQDYDLTFAILGSSDKPITVKVENTTQGTEKTLSGTDVLNLRATLTGVSEINAEASNSLRVYPNPVGETATLVFHTPKAGNVKVSVVNTAGAQVASANTYLPQGEATYSLSGLGVGNYIVSVQGNDYYSSCVVISQLENGGVPQLVLSSTISMSCTEFVSQKSATASEAIEMQYNSGDVLNFTATVNSTDATVNNYTATESEEIGFAFSFTVKFADHNDSELKSETVSYGGAATAPVDPTRTGYTFAAWDKVFDNITADLTVKATYDINSYTVTFTDHDNAVIKSETIDYGSAAAAPVDPTRTGYTFGAWDKAFDNITADLTVKATYTLINYSISYHKVGTKNISANPATYNIETADINLAEPNDSTGFIFGGWYTDAAFTNLVSNPVLAQGSTGDTAFYAKWIENTVADKDGNIYKVVVIGNQIWMAENLKATQYSDGTGIPLVTDNTLWKNLGDNNSDKAYCFYNNNESLGYGALYTYAAATNGTPHNATDNVQGVCPTGWHLPSDAEWTELATYISNDGHGGAEGTALKATSGWNSSGNGTDNYGFAALGGGRRNGDSGTSFYYGGDNGYWWSSSQAVNSSYAIGRLLQSRNSNLSNYGSKKSFGFSVRCVRDVE